MIKARIDVYNLFFAIKVVGTGNKNIDRSIHLGTYSNKRIVCNLIDSRTDLVRKTIDSLKGFIPTFTAEEINLAISAGFKRFNNSKMTINDSFQCDNELSVYLDGNISISFLITENTINNVRAAHIKI